MPTFILLVLVLLIFCGSFGYMVYRNNAQKRAREKRRNQYHDRV